MESLTATRPPANARRQTERSRGFCFTGHAAPGSSASQEDIERMHTQLVNSFPTAYIISGIEASPAAIQRQQDAILNGNPNAQLEHHLQGKNVFIHTF